MAEKKLKKGCIIGCVSALAAVIAAVAFVPLLRHMLAYFVLGQRPEPDPEYAGVFNAITELPYAHAYLPKIDRDAETICFPATVDSKTDYMEEACNIIRNINAYLSANPDAPEHQYDCDIIFSIEDSSAPSFLNCYNYNMQESTGKAERKPYFFKCMYDGGHCNPFEADLQQLSELECLESLELHNYSTDMKYYEPLDAMKNLQMLRIRTYTAVPKIIREHLKEAHPDCRIIVNNMEL